MKTVAEKLDAALAKADALVDRLDRNRVDGGEPRPPHLSHISEAHWRQIQGNCKRYDTRQIMMWGDPALNGGPYPKQTKSALNRAIDKSDDRDEKRKMQAEVAARHNFYMKHMGRADSSDPLDRVLAAADGLTRRMDALERRRKDGDGKLSPKSVKALVDYLNELKKKGLQPDPALTKLFVEELQKRKDAAPKAPQLERRRKDGNFSAHLKVFDTKREAQEFAKTKKGATVNQSSGARGGGGPTRFRVSWPSEDRKDAAPASATWNVTFEDPEGYSGTGNYPVLDFPPPQPLGGRRQAGAKAR